MQGLPTCNANMAHSAGNTWDGPNASIGKSITSFLTNPFKYYTQIASYNAIRPFPTNHTTAGVLVNPSLSSGCIGIDQFNINNFCISETLNLPIIDNEDWFNVVDSNFTVLESLKLKHIEEYEFLRQWNDEKSIQLQSDEIELIEWYENEIQSKLNELIQVFQLDSENPALEKLLLKINSAEAHKNLAIYYYNLKEFEKSFEQIYTVIDNTKKESQYNEGLKAELKLNENEHFVNYMKIQIELATEEKQLLDMAEPQIKDLEAIVAANVQISGQAALDLFEVTGIEYEFPVYKKEIDKSMEKSLSINQSNSEHFTIYPNPSSNKFTVQFVVPSNSADNFIYVYDAIGNLLNTVNIAKTDDSQVDISTEDLASGIYTCIFVSDAKLTNAAKIVIIK
jgi:tetratricopeptide (TPR) repeat protein